MRKMTECLNKICNREDWQSRWPGHLDQCPRCGTIDVSKVMIPETSEDIGILRADYNRRNIHKPGFVPSIAYDKNGHPIES